jgi:hypothetical protein
MAVRLSALRDVCGESRLWSHILRDYTVTFLESLSKIIWTWILIDGVLDEFPTGHRSQIPYHLSRLARLLHTGRDKAVCTVFIVRASIPHLQENVIVFLVGGGVPLFSMWRIDSSTWRQNPEDHILSSLPSCKIPTPCKSCLTTPSLSFNYMKTGSECIDSCFLDLGTSWRWVARSTPRPLYPRYPLHRSLGGPQIRSGRSGGKNIFHPTGLELRSILSSGP